jgi:hypothetical protein
VQISTADGDRINDKTILEVLKKLVGGINIKFCPRGDTSVSVIPGEFPVVYSFEGNALSLTFLPVPLGSVALTKTVGPWTRNAAHPDRLDISVWTSAVANLQWCDVRPRSPRFTFKDDELDVGAQVFSMGGRHEGPGVEFRHPSELFKGAGSVMSYLSRIGEEHANSSDRVKLYVGVEDQSGAAIGFYLDPAQSADKLFETSFMSNISSSVFPPLAAADNVIIERLALRGSCPTEWPRVYKLRQLMTAQEAHSALVRLAGRGYPKYVSDKKYALLVPDAERACQLLGIKQDGDASTIDPVSPQEFNSWRDRMRRRHVVCITLEFDPKLQGSFFRTDPEVDHKDSSRNVEVHVLDESGSVHPMDPWSVWLRLRSPTSMSPGIVQAVRDELFVKVVVCPPEKSAAVARSLELTFDQQIRVDFEAGHVPSAEELASVLQKRARPWLLIVHSDTAAHAMALITIAKMRRPAPVMRLLLLIPCSALASQGLGDTLGEIQQNFARIDAEVDDVILMREAVHVHPRLHDLGLRDGLAHRDAPKLFEQVRVDVTDSATPQLARSWFCGEDPMPLPWNLISGGFVPEMGNVQLLKKCVNDILMSARAGSVGQVGLVKAQSACGATATVRHVAFLLQAENLALVRWFPPSSQFPSTENLSAAVDAEMKCARDRFQRPLVIVVDEELAHHRRKLLSSMGQSSKLNECLSVLLYVRPLHPEGIRPHEVLQQPFLEPNSVPTFAGRLAVAFPESRDALFAARDYAVSSNDEADRHVFLFGLTAARGVFRPAIRWIEGLHHALPLPLRAMAFAVSFISAFALRYGKGLPGAPRQAVANALSECDATHEEIFWQLFRETPGHPHGVSCLHPFLARLFVLVSCRKAALRDSWESWLYPENIVSGLAKTATALSRNLPPNQIRLLFPVARNLLVERDIKRDFSPLISSLLESADGKIAGSPDDILQCCEKVLEILPPEKPHDGILLSRIYRFAVQSEPWRTSVDVEVPKKWARNSIETARKASEGADEKLKFHATHNLIVALGASYVNVGIGDIQEATRLLDALYKKSDPQRQAALVQIARRYGIPHPTQDGSKAPSPSPRQPINGWNPTELLQSEEFPEGL